MRRRWEQEQEASFGARVEELDSDDTDTQGVGLNFDQNRVYDPLHFMGADLPSSSRARKGYTYDTETSDSDSEGSEGGSSAVQVALRDKEEALVQSALARIRRAQAKGKSQVKLNPEELEALERRRQRMQAAASKQSGEGEKKRRGERLISVPIAESPGRKQNKSKRADDYDVRASASASSPGLLGGGPDSVYAPSGYYPPHSSSSRNSPNRSRSSSIQQMVYQQPRHYSDGARPTSSSSNSSRRPLPDEESWVPNSKRSSLSSQPHGPDPFDYQVDDGHPSPIPQQYGQGRRIASGPEVMYSTLRRTPPSYSTTSRVLPPQSSQRRKGSQRDNPESIVSSSDDSESDELNNGVQVVEREPPKERAVSRKPVAGRKKGKGR